MASRVGFEPTTKGLKVPCSATELPARDGPYHVQIGSSEGDPTRSCPSPDTCPDHHGVTDEARSPQVRQGRSSPTGSEASELGAEEQRRRSRRPAAVSGTTASRRRTSSALRPRATAGVVLGGFERVAGVAGGDVHPDQEPVVGRQAGDPGADRRRLGSRPEAPMPCAQARHAPESPGLVIPPR